MEGNKSKKTVLIIDDTPIMLRVLSKILLPLYNVKVAKGGEIGIQVACQGNVDLILLDLIMPEVSGVEVIKRLKQEESLKNVPIIFVTGNGMPDDEKEALENGATDYIPKPFSKERVIQKVSKYLK